MAKVELKIEGTTDDPVILAVLTKLVNVGPALVSLSEIAVPAAAPAPPAAGSGTPSIVVMGSEAEAKEFSGKWIDPTLPPTAAPAPPAAAPAPPAGVELDGEGLPWDSRIHASTKTKRQSDSTWKLKKGADPAEVEKVKAELRQTMALAVPAAAPAPPAAAPAPPTAAPAPPTAAPAPPTAAPAPPTAAPAVPTAAPAVPTTFTELIQVVTSKQQAGVFTVQEAIACCQAHGLASLPLLAARPDLLPAVYADMETIWRTRE